MGKTFPGFLSRCRRCNSAARTSAIAQRFSFTAVTTADASSASNIVVFGRDWLRVVANGLELGRFVFAFTCMI
jgi:hypothetical protein